MIKKDIIIISGNKSKGVCKLTDNPARAGYLKGTCHIDFKPKDARLYIVGDSVYEIAVAGMETRFDVPVYKNGSVSCVLFTEGDIMYGTTGSSVKKSSVLRKIETFKKTKINPGPENVDLPKKDINHEINYENDNAEIKNPDKDEELIKSKDAVFSERNPLDTPAEDCDTAASPEQKSGFSLNDGVHYDGTNFYLAIKPQLDEMFICYPSEEQLNATVPNSKWVKIDTGDDYYVVGILFSDSAAAYICYGIPGTYGVKPPSDMAEMCVWLPLSVDDAYGDGYWVIYQSAKDGKIIK